jgi:hypothetical protein
MNSESSLLKLWARFLTFRARLEDYQSLGSRQLIMGLIVCWIVGMGRYWDDPRAILLQKTGVGSVIYVFALAALLWLTVKPIDPERFSYVGILTFVTMTSPPAILYAIPVEKWMTLEVANETNLYFLGIVALWRLGLWVHYLRRYGLFSGATTFVAATLPLAFIFIALVEMNLHHVVFDIMGGIRNADQSSQDAAYWALWILGGLAFPVSCFAGLGWFSLVLQSWHNRRHQ